MAYSISVVSGFGDLFYALNDINQPNTGGSKILIDLLGDLVGFPV
jgi:hypothetical protein